MKKIMLEKLISDDKINYVVVITRVQRTVRTPFL